jgi:hypothetical protein
MRLRHKVLAAPALWLALAAALAGCGGSSPSNGVASKTPTEILAAAKSAADGAASVHVAGSIESAGQPISLDMELVADKGGRGQLELGGLGIQLLDLDRTVFVKGNAAFYSHFLGAGAPGQLRGRWLKASAKSGTLAQLASLADLHEVIDTALEDHGTLSRAAPTTIDGKRALGITDSADGGTLYVAATGAPYPLEIAEAGSGAGRLVFDRWNQPVTLTPPSDAVDIDQLKSRL